MVLLVAAALYGHQWYQKQLEPVGDHDTPVYVHIEEGYTTERIADTLAEEGLIRSELAFRVYAYVHDISHQMQAGFYSLAPNQSTPDILAVITQGETATRTVHIPSGSSLDDVADAFVEAGFSRVKVESALQEDYESPLLRDRPDGASLEGYLFPDTYSITYDMTPRETVEMILTNADQRINGEIISGWEAQDLSIHEGLTLASIVQKESPLEDMPEIAGVFYNRLEQDMRLESDATVNYALGTSNLQPTYADTETDHPYNTYRIDGLPPGPVGNPELAAIEATANPVDHEWLFFLHTPDEESIFSRTYDEHIDNRRRYLD